MKLRFPRQSMFPLVNVSPVVLCALLSIATMATGQETLEQRLGRQDLEIRLLSERLDRYEHIFNPAQIESPHCDEQSPKPKVPVIAEASRKEPDCGAAAAGSKDALELHYRVLYDKGFVLRPVNPKKHPYELKLNAWIQFRHAGFSRDETMWTDNAGNTFPIRSRNVFDIERARLTFRGFAIDRRLTYFLQLDGDSDGRHTVDFFDYWWAWQCSDSFKVLIGKRKVSASRQWLLGARRTRFVDRPMANDFFRPDRTLGIWGLGSIGERLHYELMLGNGYRTSNLPNSLTDDQLTFATTAYWDCTGDFGSRLTDFESTREMKSRIGHSFVFSPIRSNTAGTPLSEATFLRLADGTPITTAGALAPMVTVSDFDVYFYGVDAAARYRGWSINAELFLRWIESIRGGGPLPRGEVFQKGFYVEAGMFLIPKRLDVNVRYSGASDDFGSGSEVAAGFNWFPLERPHLKWSVDLTSLRSSPLQNTATDILVGDDGLLVRTQFQAEF